MADLPGNSVAITSTMKLERFDETGTQGTGRIQDFEMEGHYDL